MAVTEKILSQQTQTDSLTDMVANHYDNRILMELAGEIQFDPILSKAEVDGALKAYRKVTGQEKIPDVVYLPMAGPLRHVPSLLDSGVENAVAVDLSKGSLDAGMERYGNDIENNVEIHNSDIRDIEEFVPEEGFDLAISMGNSFGDVTNWEGHLSILQAFADSLAENGVFVFDYVGNRYNPPVGEIIKTEWSDVHVNSQTGIQTPVKDVRSRKFVPFPGQADIPYEEQVGVLRFTCEVTNVQTGEILVPLHGYEKLVIPDAILEQQFAAVGLRLVKLGPITENSAYHRQRVAEKDDLGMMGKPDNLYVAVKDRLVENERRDL